MHAHEHIQFSSRFLSYFPYQGARAKTRAESTLSLYPRPTCPVDLLCRDLWDFLNSCEKARLRECPCGCKRFFLLSPRDLYYSETCWYRSPHQRVVNAVNQQRLRSRLIEEDLEKVAKIIQQLRDEGVEDIIVPWILDKLEARRQAERIENPEAKKRPKMTVRRLQTLQQWEEDKYGTPWVTAPIDWRRKL
jgi:hypothetical protein